MKLTLYVTGNKSYRIESIVNDNQIYLITIQVSTLLEIGHACYYICILNKNFGQVVFTFGQVELNCYFSDGSNLLKS